MTIPSESLRYRPARREDVSALSTLWEESTDWGMFTSGEWRTWYESAPYGAPLVVVAENGSESKLWHCVSLQRWRRPGPSS